MFTTRTYVAFGALVAVGAATLYVTSKKDPHVRGDGAPASSPYPVMKKDDIDEIDIAEPGKTPVVLKKVAGAWTVTAPVADQADAKAAADAVDALVDLKLRDAIAENPASYDKVGVKDDEVIAVTPKKAGAPLVKLLVGKGQNVRVDPDPRVWSTSNLKRYALVREVKMWRNRKVADIAADKLDRVDIVYPDGAHLAVKKEPPPASQPDSQPASQPGAKAPPKPADKWDLVDGADKIGGTLDDTLAGKLTIMLGKLEADDFAADDAKPETTGLDHPRATITITPTPDGGAPVVLLLGKDDGQDTYVKRQDQPRVWKLHKFDADHVPTSAVQWRDKTMVKLDPGDVVKAEWVNGTDRTVLEHPDTKPWHATFPAELTEIDPSRALTVLRTLQNLRGARIIEKPDLAALGLDKPVATATFWKKDGSQVKILLGTKDKSEIPAMLAGDKTIFALADYTGQQFMKKPSDFKKAPAPPPGMPGQMPGRPMPPGHPAMPAGRPPM